MKARTVIITLLIGIVLYSYSQDKRPIFIGLQPGFTVEPFYEKNEFDINIIPITLQIPLGKRIDFRITTLANYHFGGKKNGFSDLGFQFVLPVYLKKKENTKTSSKGFYIGPVIGIGRNMLNDHYTTTLAIEPGFQFPAMRSFAISMGLQFGGSYFAYDNQPNVWRNHFGFKINIGFWVNKSKTKN